MRLIDANKLPHTVARFEYGQATKCVLKHDIDADPTIDAVEVVRCRDCVFRKRLFANEPPPYLELCKRFDKFVGLDCFCSWGKRKEEHNGKAD